MPTVVGDSRLIVPRPPPRYVSRPRLLGELDDAAETPLTLLSAGPGAGKTVLLSDWVRRTGLQVAWLTPTAADARPQRFWPLLVSSLRAAPGVPWEPSATVPADAASDFVQALFSRVPDLPARLAIVIDDAHVLSDPDVLDGLDGLVRGSRPGLRLIMAARSDPLLPLHRYRLAGQMHEVRAADLAMTAPEIREMLRIHGVTLQPRDLDILAARTEGWAAGVRLSAMRMEGAEFPDEFVSELALDQGSIGEYLINEVLHQRPEPERRLLMETSFLDEVTGPLAGAVTGLDGCGEMLAQLARDNSFVIPLDAAQDRFRYHQLLAEILRYLLQREAGPAVMTLQRRAAAWFQDAGDLRNALYWAVRVGDRPRIASLLARGGFTQAFVHRQDLSGVGLHDLAPLRGQEGTEAGQAAEFALAGSVIVAALAGAGAAAGELEQVQARAAGAQSSDPDLLATADLLELVLGQKAGHLDAVDAAAGRLLNRCDQAPGPVVPGLRAAVLLAQAGAHLWHGRPEDVGVLLQEALTCAERDGPPVLELEVLGMSAYFESYWSRNGRADELTRQARGLLRKHGDLAAPAMLEVAAALRCLLAGDVSGHAQAMQRVLVPDVVGADPGAAVLLALGQAGLLLAGGKENKARAVLQEAGPSLPPMLALRREVMLAELDMSLGRPRAALQRLAEHRGGRLGIVTAVPCARAYLLLSDLRNASECVRSVLATPSEQTGRYTVIDAMLCDAQITQLNGDPGRALEILLRALEIAQGDIVLPFLLVTDAFAALLSRHPVVAAQWPAALPQSLTSAIPPARPAFDANLPEPLTQREQAVLRYLATSMSTSEIADELCLSVNTVKTHLAAIYRKLPARRRREAVLRARQLELI